MFFYSKTFSFVLCVLVLWRIVANLPRKPGLESTQMKTILNKKTWPMLFFDIWETPKKIWPHFFHFLAHF